MLDFLSPLWDLMVCAIKWTAGAIAAGATELANGLIAAVMALVGPLLALLPEWTPPEQGLPGFVAWLNWIFPLDHLVAAVSLVAIVLPLWHLAAIGLRWARAVE